MLTSSATAAASRADKDQNSESSVVYGTHKLTKRQVAIKVICMEAL